MKRIAIMSLLALSFAACNNAPQDDAQVKQAALKQVRDSIRLDSFNRAAENELRIAEEKQQLAAVRAAQPSSRSTTRRTYVKGVNETYTTTQPQKKGWSKAAKGAAIGAGAGAVTGIIVDKKDGRGAVVGGIVGAGTGYVIGRSKDKADGRVE